MEFIPAQEKIAYFSMEIALENRLPTYSGGLGVLAGDTLKSAADLGVPIVAISLVYHKGYFVQKIDTEGHQKIEDVIWDPNELLEKMPQITKITLEGKNVYIKCWRYIINGIKGDEVPVFFLDTNLVENAPEHRNLTDQLYGGDQRYRILQEAILGIGGIRMLKELGFSLETGIKYSYNKIAKFHMNEGHAAFLTLALLYHKKQKNPEMSFSQLTDWLKTRSIFTTHTPVPAGHDIFSKDLVTQSISINLVRLLNQGECWESNKTLNMTHLALQFSSYVNGVAKRHGEVSQNMFKNNEIAYITNGVHAYTWTADAIRELFNRSIPKWRKDNFYLRAMIDVDIAEIQQAHQKAKQAFIKIVKARSGTLLNEHIFTIGFARRAAEYKRADFMFQDVERLNNIAKNVGPIQIVFAGKAHPQDLPGQALISRIYEQAKKLDKKRIVFVYVEDYDMELGRAVTTGVDLWVNNPRKPLEASGTSGMKSAINGVPSLSTLDGWWVEGFKEGVTGWLIEDDDEAFVYHSEEELSKLREAAIDSMYQKLEKKIIPMYYNEPNRYGEIMRSTMAINGPYFNTHRMVLQYLINAYTI